MAARRISSLMHGDKKQTDGVVWHREHRSKKGRWSLKRWASFKRKRALEAQQARKMRKFRVL